MISKSLEETEKIAGEVLTSVAGAKSHLATQETTSQKLGAGEKPYFVELSPTSHGRRATVLLLEGNLGSGKTTFTQALAKHLGIKENLTSPTFVLLKSYNISPQATERFNLSVKKLVHIDAYRLNSGADLLKLGWNDLINDPSNLIVIEWPEQVSDLWHGDEQKINFKFIDEQTREISVGFLL